MPFGAAPGPVEAAASPSQPQDDDERADSERELKPHAVHEALAEDAQRLELLAAARRGGAGGDTSGKVRHVSREIALGLLDHDGIAHGSLTSSDQTVSGYCLECQVPSRQKACLELSHDRVLPNV